MANQTIHNQTYNIGVQSQIPSLNNWMLKNMKLEIQFLFFLLFKVYKPQDAESPDLVPSN